MRVVDVRDFDIPSDENDYDELVAFADTMASIPQFDAVPMSVIEDIKAEIAESQNVVSETLKFDKEDCFYNGKWAGFELALAIIDKHIESISK